MTRNRAWVGVVTLLTLGSGVANLFSVLHPSAPQIQSWLKEFFPLEFFHFSRFLTLLLGFALVVSSLNIYKRKKRAFQLVLLLAILSTIFHLAKGHDYEHSLFSLALILVLLFYRKNFTVRSSIPHLGWGIFRMAVAAVLVFGYGVIGFWILDPTEFGINFTIPDAIKKTLLYLSLQGDPQIVPHTRYARWFLDSLLWMTITAIGYSLFALFRPVVYLFKTLPQERESAAKLLEKYGRSSLDYFKVWPDKSYFFSPSHNCFLAYGVGANFAVVLADPVGPEEEVGEIVEGFRELCQENDWGLAFHQTLPDFLPIYKKLGFKKLKIGDEAIVDLTQFSLSGKSMKEFRNVINHLERIGIHIVGYEPPISDEVIMRVKEVSNEWLKIPGRRERRFTLGNFQPDYVKSTPLVLAVDKTETVLAFVNLIPSYHPGEAIIDLMRRRPDAPHSIMDYLFVKLFSLYQVKGFQRFSLGMAPMSGFQEKEEASPEERAVHYFFQHLNFLFSYRGLLHYKAKFATFWEPRYAIYRQVLDLPRLAMALNQISEF